MIESTTYQPEDRWSAEPLEPQPPRTWRTRTVVLLVLLAALAGGGSTLGWLYWRGQQPVVTIPVDSVAVLLDDPMLGHVTTDQVLIAVPEVSGDREHCVALGGDPLESTRMLGQPALCVLGLAPVLRHDRATQRLLVPLPVDLAATVHARHAAQQPVLVLPWQQSDPQSNSEQSMVQPQP